LAEINLICKDAPFVCFFSGVLPESFVSIQKVSYKKSILRKSLPAFFKYKSFVRGNCYMAVIQKQDFENFKKFND